MTGIYDTYPYERVQNYNRLDGLEQVPKILCDYLLDLPSNDYQPRTTNDYPRVRLMKYLYYDDARPLDQAALNTAQKLSLVYDPYHPTEPPTDKGYRIFPNAYVTQTQLTGQTILRCYLGRIVPRDVFTAEVGIVFEILTQMSYENNSKSEALSRLTAMEQCLWECCNGVNFAGVGTMYMDRREHGDCGSWGFTDEEQNVGRRIVFGMTFKAANAPNDISIG